MERKIPGVHKMIPRHPENWRNSFSIPYENRSINVFSIYCSRWNGYCRNWFTWLFNMELFPMNLDKFVRDTYKTSKKYNLHLYTLWDLIDHQEIKRAYRDKPEDLEQSLEVIKRYLQIQENKKNKYKNGK